MFETLKTFFTWIMHEWARLIMECCTFTKVLGRLRMVWGAMKMRRLSVFNSIRVEYAVVNTSPKPIKVWKIKFNVLLDYLENCMVTYNNVHFFPCFGAGKIAPELCPIILDTPCMYASGCDIAKLYVLLTECIYVFYVHLWNITTIILLCSIFRADPKYINNHRSKIYK